MTVRLPLADTRARELETCGYCPKLCRWTCTVSNAEPRESLTPWGKMSSAWLAARGDLPLEPSVTELPYACCGCMKCTHFCAHDNPVFETLLSARAAFREQGAVPPAVDAALERFRGWTERQSQYQALRALGGKVEADSPLLVVGCSYVRHAEETAGEAVRAARSLLSGVVVWTECCGLYPRQAGDLELAGRLRERLTRAAKGRRVVTVDVGCTQELRELGAEWLPEVAARRPDELGRVPELASEPSVRYHDPCRASRAGVATQAPRTVLQRALGRHPDEFSRNHEQSACSGGGGLLPVSYPEISRAIADDRLREHEQQGGGLIVTGCASSLQRFRTRGARALDLSEVLARSVRAGAGK